MGPKFTIFKGSNDQYYFNLKASNGEKVLSGEGYISKSSCLNGIESVKTNAPIDDHYEKKVSGNGKYFFVLKAANGEIIGVSEMYDITHGRDKGIGVVKLEAPDAQIEDKT